jgi:hypothetical protein
LIGLPARGQERPRDFAGSTLVALHVPRVSFQNCPGEQMGTQRSPVQRVDALHRHELPSSEITELDTLQVANAAPPLKLGFGKNRSLTTWVPDCHVTVHATKPPPLVGDDLKKEWKTPEMQEFPKRDVQYC